jgi:Zn-dependent peptidase ImmA (M78 family)
MLSNLMIETITPGKRAAELIEYYSVKSPEELNLEGLSNAEGLIVEEDDLSGHIGRISFTSDFGLIKIDSKIKEHGRKQFTLAHEMGHYFNEREIRSSAFYKCSALDIFSFKPPKTYENDANEFAASLLMYKPWFGKFIINRKINMELVKDIAGYFNVSLTAAAIRYAEIGKYPAAVIMSRDGRVAWKCINEYFPFKWIPTGYKVREESAAYDFFTGGETQECEDLMPAYVWFAEDFHCKEGVYLYEQNVVMKNYGWVLTLLWEERRGF